MYSNASKWFKKDLFKKKLAQIYTSSDGERQLVYHATSVAYAEFIYEEKVYDRKKFFYF